MFDDIIEKKRLTIDDITWDKCCGNCKYGNAKESDLDCMVVCEKIDQHRDKNYFCYDWQETS